MTSPAVGELQRQHAHLRALLDRCARLLADAEAGRAVAEALTAAVRAMARALTDHHAYEEAHLELVGDDARHKGHHAALALGLDDPSVRALAAVLRDLRDHLAHEDAVLAGL